MQKQAAVTETARWGRRLTKPRADDLQLGAETRSELRTTRSPPGAARHTGSEGKCYAINLNPAPFTARSLPVRNSTQPGSSSHNILRNFRGGKKNSNQNLHKGCQTNSLLHNETGSRICFERQLGLAGSTGSQDEPCS